MSLPHPLAASELLTALRGASCPSTALRLYSLLRIHLLPSDPSSFARRAAVLALKPLSAAGSLPLLSHFHAHLIRSNLLASPQVASSLLRSYSLLSPAAAHHLFDQIPPATCNLFVVNVMLASLCRSSDLASARLFFDDIPDKDVVSWSTMLACYFSNSSLAEGLAFFRTMTFTTQLDADFVMLVTVLTRCATAGLLQPFCRSIHGYIVRRRVPTSMHLGTALIDCYAKVDRLDYASRVFALVPSRNVIHWTTMICGMAMHLHTDKAIQLFEEMRRQGVRPTEITFTAVLSACGHAGLVKQAREFFKLMVEEYDLEPTIKHYGCMVDVFAKAGQLEDAYDVIKNMRVEPNVFVWSSLLAACKRLKNFDIAVEGVEKVLAMEISDENGGVYSLISDLYAMGGQFDDVLKVRRLMEEHNIRKNTEGNYAPKPTDPTYAVPCRWSAPIKGTVKLNSDAAVCLLTGESWMGGAARDWKGQVLLAVGRKMNQCASVEEAEALAALLALTELKKVFSGPVELEMDCSVVGWELMASIPPRSPHCAILHDLKIMLQSFQSYQISITRREGNRLAHFLAARSKKVGDALQYGDVPKDVKHVWNADCTQLMD